VPERHSYTKNRGGNRLKGRLFLAFVVFLLFCPASAEETAPSPSQNPEPPAVAQNWIIPWEKSIELEVGPHNPKSDFARGLQGVRPHPYGTAVWLEPKGDKYALDLLPPDGHLEKNGVLDPPIKIYAPIGGTIYCNNLDPTPDNTCKDGHGGYGNHIIIDTNDNERFMIAHLERFNPELNFYRGEMIIAVSGKQTVTCTEFQSSPRLLVRKVPFPSPYSTPEEMYSMGAENRTIRLPCPASFRKYVSDIQKV
jgi:hypothetical protein